MTTIATVSLTTEAVPVLEQHHFDEARLERYMLEHIEGFTVPLTVAQSQGGMSNPTFILADGFITLHLLGGTAVSVIASQSGVVWAGIAVGMATLAVASFVAALTFLVAALTPKGPWAWLRRQSGSRLPSGP